MRFRPAEVREWVAAVFGVPPDVIEDISWATVTPGSPGSFSPHAITTEPPVLMWDDPINEAFGAAFGWLGIGEGSVAEVYEDGWSPDMAGGMTMDELLGIRDELGLRRLSPEDLAAEAERRPVPGYPPRPTFAALGVEMGFDLAVGSPNRFEMFHEQWAAPAVVAPRCTPEAPCETFSVAHVEIFGECFVAQP